MRVRACRAESGAFFVHKGKVFYDETHILQGPPHYGQSQLKAYEVGEFLNMTEKTWRGANFEHCGAVVFACNPLDRALLVSVSESDVVEDAVRHGILARVVRDLGLMSPKTACDASIAEMERRIVEVMGGKYVSGSMKSCLSSACA